MAYTRITALWGGIAGMPGYTRLKFLGDLDAAGCVAAAARIRTFFDTIKGDMVNGCTITIPGVGEIFDGNGRLTGTVTFTPPAIVTGTSAQSYVAGSGFVINWLTNTFVNGRRLRGRTFIVPMTASGFDNSGTLATGFLATVSAAATALRTGIPEMAVHGGDPVRGYTLSIASGSSIPDRAALLRSRRD